MLGMMEHLDELLSTLLMVELAVYEAEPNRVALSLDLNVDLRLPRNISVEAPHVSDVSLNQSEAWTHLIADLVELS